jgi:hypothetical protein
MGPHMPETDENCSVIALQNGLMRLAVLAQIAILSR